MILVTSGTRYIDSYICVELLNSGYEVIAGKLKEFGVFGNDYDALDGTSVRDYIHVVDLACGHVKALKKIDEIYGDRRQW